MAADRYVAAQAPLTGPRLDAFITAHQGPLAELDYENICRQVQCSLDAMTAFVLPKIPSMNVSLYRSIIAIKMPLLVYSCHVLVERMSLYQVLLYLVPLHQEIIHANIIACPLCRLKQTLMQSPGAQLQVQVPL